MSETFNMNKKAVIETPKEEILVGIIIDINKTTWANLISPDKLNKFDNPEEDILNIKFEVTYKDKQFKGEETYRYYEQPMSNSKLGKFLNKYEDLKAGKEIKVVYNKEGFPSIMID